MHFSGVSPKRAAGPTDQKIVSTGFCTVLGFLAPFMKRFTHYCHRTAFCGFTRLELAATVAGLGLLLLVAIPALAQPFSRSSRLVCLNNLRQIGQGFQLWGNDHNDEPPFYVSSGSGGTRGGSEAPQAYYHFAALSNELRTPRLLACPTDPLVTAAQDFSNNPGGLLSSGYKNNSVSYFVSHGRIATGPDLLAGDRNLLTSGAVACPIFTSTRLIARPQVRWSPELHAGNGNVLMSSGDAVQTSDEGLRDAVSSSAPHLDIHLVTPR
jgi:hypothetical protein